MSELVPVEIPDAEHDLVIERAAAIDVAKAFGKVCVRLPGKSGRRFSRVWDVPARTGAISELAEQLVELDIEKVTVESTSDYWRIWYYLLEDKGLDVQLVNARDVKNVPGRPKTSWMRSGCARSPNDRCCGPRLCRRRRSGGCVTTPGCART